MPRPPRRGPKPAPPEPERVDPAEPYVSPQELRAIYLELAQRKIEALNLYEPLPLQQAFHQSTALERVCWGSNRSGKTLSTHVELARACLGRDPFSKYPKQDGRAYLVGYRGKEIGEVNYRKLFWKGAFKIIRDPKTDEWRSVRPREDYDAANRHLWRPAPPLIPARYHMPIAWENKKDMIPASVRFHTGWELNFFSSQGVPPSGSDIDLAVFDEEMESALWYPEVSARLADREGKFVWGATPQRGTEQLYDLCAKAEDLHAKGEPNPRIVEFKLTLADNPHMTDSAKLTLMEKYENDPMEYAIRIEGEFAIVSYKFYPEFHKQIHGIDSFPVPHDWTRYAIVDPGHQPCSILFVAVPPKDNVDYQGQKVVYDELVIPNCNAVIFGQRMGAKCGGQSFQAFIIDGRAGKITDMGSGLNLESQYAKALKANNVSSVSTGHGFLWGSDDRLGGVEAVRNWLQVRKDAKPTLLYFKDVCKVFENQMVRYHYKRDATSMSDQPVKKHDHLCFVAGTMVATESGPVPIENVKVGDLVWTRDGLRPVVVAGMTSESAAVMEVETETGRLVGTPDHPVFVEGVGFVAIDCLRYGDTLLSCQQNQNPSLSSSTASRFVVTQTQKEGLTGCISSPASAIGRKASGDSMKRFGKPLMARSPKGGTFTIWTTTRSITRSAISNASPSSNIGSDTHASTRLSNSPISKKFAPSPLHGIEVRKAESGIRSTPRKSWQTLPTSNLSVSDVASLTRPNSSKEAEASFALTFVGQRLAGLPASIMSNDDARLVMAPSSSTDTRKLPTAPTRVRSVRALSKPQPVYSLTVEGSPEFFANGILVHNCDGLRYAAAFGCPYVKPKAAKKADVENRAMKALAAKRERKKKAAGSDHIHLGPGKG